MGWCFAWDFSLLVCVEYWWWRTYLTQMLLALLSIKCFVWDCLVMNTNSSKDFCCASSSYLLLKPWSIFICLCTLLTYWRDLYLVFSTDSWRALWWKLKMIHIKTTTLIKAAVQIEVLKCPGSQKCFKLISKCHEMRIFPFVDGKLTSEEQLLGYIFLVALWVDEIVF